MSGIRLVAVVFFVVACTFFAHALQLTSSPPATAALTGIVPSGALSHFCIVSGWDAYNQTLST